MRNLLKIISFLILTFSFSCEKQPLFVKCDDCTATKPAETGLTIKLDYYSYGGGTVVNIYSGNIEDSVLFRTLQTFSTEISISVTLNKKYTVTALYYIPDKYNTTYTAVDSATPRVSYIKDQCTDPCYYAYDKVVDLRLKYTK